MLWSMLQKYWVYIVVVIWQSTLQILVYSFQYKADSILVIASCVVYMFLIHAVCITCGSLFILPYCIGVFFILLLSSYIIRLNIAYYC